MQAVHLWQIRRDDCQYDSGVKIFARDDPRTNVKLAGVTSREIGFQPVGEAAMFRLGQQARRLFLRGSALAESDVRTILA